MVTWSSTSRSVGTAGDAYIARDMIAKYEFTVINSEVYEQDSPYGVYKFLVLRNFLIQFALLAMFIGVFLQMSFEEKNITES